MSAVMSDQQSSNNVAEFFSPGPGERLRAARLSMGFDLARIASELHLTSPVVESLEADQYGDIGARVFVRGYLRNYARIVGMPVESILRQFDEKWPDDGVRPSMLRESPTLPADVGPSRGMAGAMSWLLVIGLLVLFLMWWRGYLDEIVPEQIRPGNLIDGGLPAITETGPLSEPADDPLPDGSLLLPDSSVVMPEPTEAVDDALPGGPLQPAPTAGSATTNQPGVATPVPAADTSDASEPTGDIAAAGSLALPTSSTAPDASPPVETATGSEASGAVTEPAQAAAADSAVADSVAAEPDAGAPVVEGTQQIVMTFSAPCWVDVRDSERKFKLFGEMEKGSRKVLGGVPPYKLVIGNAEAVTITVNGRPFDLAPYAKGNVARFTLNP